MKQTEQLLRDDKNLREAVRRNTAEAPQLSADFSVRLQQHLQPVVSARRRWYRMAAVFIGTLFLCGLAYATWHVFAPAKGEQQPMAEADDSRYTPHTSLSAPVRFDDVRLDSILTVVSAHYGKAVSYRSEEPRRMRLITTWNPDEPLAAFIDHLNMFDYLRLTLQNDTIFVEGTNGEEDVQ